MSQVTVTLLETNFEVEYDFKITTHGYGDSGPSLEHPGDPPEPAEFDLEILSINLPKGSELELPDWLKKIIEQHLYERDDVNDAVQEADQEDGRGSDNFDDRNEP